MIACIKPLLALCLCAWLSSGTQAQTVRLSGVCIGFAPDSLQLFIRAIDSGRQDAEAVPLDLSGKTFSGQAAASMTGFYCLCGSAGQSQIMLPVYLPDTARRYKLELTFADGCPAVRLDADNSALSEYNRVYCARERIFWNEGRGWKADRLMAFLTRHIAAADSIASRYSCSEPVAEYLRLWARSAVCDGYANMQHMARMRHEKLPFSLTDILGDMPSALDSPTAALFPTIIMAVAQSLPKGGLMEKLESLHMRYSSEEVRREASSLLLDSHIRQFDFSEDYEGGLAEIQAAASKYGLGSGCVEAFKMRRASAKGSPFPDVELTDTDGNAVSFASFRGSYVYVDVWASWCGPCCKEAPSLQALAKELSGNKNIRFVSVSIDKSPEAWRKKMADLGLDGVQLLNRDNTLAESLNIKGIPHFLIYDREGRLYMHNAPRPSSPQLKALLNGLR